MGDKTIRTGLCSFVLDEYGTAYTASVETGAGVVRLFLDADGVEKELRTFGKYADDLAALDRAMRGYAAEELLDSANDWLEDTEDEDKPDHITKEMFIARMSDPELYFSPDGGISAYYLDGGMFWGHAICVYVDADGGFSDADIAG